MSRSNLVMGGAIAIIGLAFGAALLSRGPTPKPEVPQQTSAVAEEKEEEIATLRSEINALKDMIASAPASGQGQSADPEFLSLKQDVAALKEQLATLGDEVRSRARLAPSPQLQTGPQLSEEERQEQAKQAVTERMNYIASRFESEDVDAQWGNSVETQLISTFQNPALQHSALVNAECRSTLCRLEVAHEDGTDLTEFQSVLADETAKIAPEGAIQQAVGPDGKMRSIIFLARSGARIPDPNTR